MPTVKKTRAGGQQRAQSASATETPTAPVAKRRRLLLTSVLLIGFVAMAYGNSVGNGFVWDDHEQIVLNPSVHGGAPLAALFSSDARFADHTQSLQASDYRPLQMLVYRAVFAAFGANATAFHIVSLIFAAACALGVFAVFWRLTRQWPIAASAAALFAVHPVHAEAVDWIVALDDLGFALCLLLTLYCFLVARERAASPRLSTRWLALALSGAAFAAALLWKETAVVFPLLVVVLVLTVDLPGDSEQQRQPGLQARMLFALRRSTPYWIIVGCYLAVRAAVLGGLSAGLRDWQLTPLQAMLNGLWLLLCYWAKLAVPLGLNAYYPFTPIRTLADLRALGALSALHAVAAAAFVIVRKIIKSGTAPSKNARLAVFSALWVLILLLPAMDLGALGRNAFTERYLYLPSAGFCLLAVLAAARLLQHLPVKLRRAAGASALALMLLGFTVETILRNAVWKDDATLFASTLESSPDAPFVRNMVATTQSADPAQAQQAEENYRQAITLANATVPADRLDAVVAYQGLASLLGDQGQFEQALQALDNAHRMEPENADTDAARGLVLARAGHGLEAEPLLQHALAAKPDNENVLATLGIVTRDDLHRPADAVRLFERALAVHSAEDDFAASQHNNLGATYADAGDFAGAIKQLREAVRILPSDVEFHINLATALAASGRMAEARVEAVTAMQLAPNDPMPRELLNKLGPPER